MTRRFQKIEQPKPAKPKGKPGRRPLRIETAPDAAASAEERVPLLTDRVGGLSGSQAPTLTVEHLLRQCGQLWATTKETAAMLGVSEPTLFALFKRTPKARRIYEDAKLVGNVSQRRRNIVLAEKNAIMSIFLSKNQLGMRDNMDLNGSIDVAYSPVLVLLKQLDNGKHGKQIDDGSSAKVIEHQPAPAGKVIKEGV